jgi:hypothetical protein
LLGLFVLAGTAPSNRHPIPCLEVAARHATIDVDIFSTVCAKKPWYYFSMPAHVASGMQHRETKAVSQSYGDNLDQSTGQN